MGAYLHIIHAIATFTVNNDVCSHLKASSYVYPSSQRTLRIITTVSSFTYVQ